MATLSKVLDLTDSLVAHIDAVKGQYLSVNCAHQRILGYSENELVGTNPFDLVYSKDRDRLVSILNEGLSKGAGETLSGTVEYRIYDKNNNLKTLRAKVALEGPDLYLVCEDVTEQKRKEKELEGVKQRVKNIVENIDDGIYEADLQGNIMFANEGLARILDVSLEELIGMNYVNFCDKRYVREVYETFNEVYKTQTPREAHGWKLRKRNGREIEINTTIKPAYDLEGAMYGFFGTTKDLTEYNNALKFEAALETIGGIIHETNQDLQVVLGYSTMLLEEKQETDEDYLTAKSLAEATGRLANKIKRLQRIKTYKTKPYVHRQIIDIDKENDT
ncbi:MAG: PAS domain S-box protein [Candidatus Nanoarchaeia archaeon]